MRWRADLRMVLVSVACAIMPLVGCAPSPRRSDDSALSSRSGAASSETTLSSRSGAASSDTAKLSRLEREARALAGTVGCETAASCRAAPVGVRGCGGPRDYVVYCAASTDTAALLSKLGELGRAEAAYNEREGVVSTCQMRLPPALTVSGGRCSATR